MKLFCAPIVCLLLAALLGGCSKTESENDLALQLRSDFLAMDGCSGTMDVTADYGQRVYEYTVSFSSTQKDGMTLVITAPEEVAGITATVENGQTFLKFDGVQLSPLDALPAFIAAMQSGYIAETGSEMLGETETLRLCCREPEKPAGEGLETVLWFDKAQKTLLRGELRSDGTTVVRCEFSAFIVTKSTTEKG